MAQNTISKTVILALVRTSFCNVETPKDFNDGKGAKYMSNFLIPKNSPDAQALIDAVSAVKNAPENRAVFGAWTQNHNWPISDGDLGEAPEARGHWVIKVKSDRKPALWDVTNAIRGNAIPAALPNAIYSGCYVAAEVHAYPFNKSSKGVAFVFGSGGLCKRADGEEFGGSANATPEAATQKFGAFISDAAPAFGQPAPQGQGYQAPRQQGYQAPQGQGYQAPAPQGQGYQAPVPQQRRIVGYDELGDPIYQ